MPNVSVPLLHIQGLTSHYGRIQALHGIDCEIQAGELVALVGANGAGKTTLLRTLSGVQPATGGTIYFNNQNITQLSPDQRVRLGISQVPEGRQVFSPLSVEDNLRLGAYTRPHSEVSNSINQVYQLFPILQTKCHQSAGTLSGGQQQMLAIGRALVAHPALLLLDEPSMGLAPKLVHDIFEKIQLLKDTGMTIFLVEQNAHVALSIADRGYVIEMGKIVLADTGTALLENAKVKEAYLGI